MSKNPRRQQDYAIKANHPRDGAMDGNNSTTSIHSVNLKARANSDLTAGTAFSDDALAGWGDDYFIGWYAQFVVNNDGTSNLTRGNTRRVTDYTDAGVFTIDTFGSDFVAGDEFIMLQPNYFDNEENWVHETISITMTADPETGTQVEHVILAVTGLCEIQMVINCTTSLVGSSATISLGPTGALTALIDTTTAAEIIATELWYDTTPTLKYGIGNDAILKYITDGLDLSYDVNTANITAGVLQFNIKWRPLETGAYCLADDGLA